MTRRADEVVAGLRARRARAVGARRPSSSSRGRSTAAAEALERAIARGAARRPRRQRPPRRRQLRRRRGDGAARGPRRPTAPGRGRSPRFRPRSARRPADARAERRDALAGARRRSPTRRPSARRETTLVIVWGDVRTPGRLRGAARHAARAGDRAPAGGATEPVGLVFPGGPAGPPLAAERARHAARPRGARARAAPRSAPAAMLVVGASACPVAIAASVARLLRARELRAVPAVHGRHRRASRAIAARRSRTAARGRATCATCTTWPASCPATATARTAAAPPPSRRGFVEAIGGVVEAHVGSLGLSVARRCATPTRSLLARRSARRSRRPSWSSCGEAAEGRNDLVVLVLATIASYPLGLWLGNPGCCRCSTRCRPTASSCNRLRRGERGGGGAGDAVVGGDARDRRHDRASCGGRRTWPTWCGTATPYKDEMFRWIRTGRGAEGNIRLFLPHAPAAHRDLRDARPRAPPASARS